MEFVDFEQTHTEQGSALLTAQFQRILKTFPLLPQRIANQNVTRDFLAGILRKEDFTGVAMLERGNLRGYLIGAYGGQSFSLGGMCMCLLGILP